MNTSVRWQKAVNVVTFTTILQTFMGESLFLWANFAQGGKISDWFDFYIITLLTTDLFHHMILVMYTVYAPLFYIEVVASLEIIYTPQKN